MEDNLDIQHLIETKNFSDLSRTEKSAVLNEITQEEYEQRRYFILNTKLFLDKSVNEMKPAADYKRSVAAIMHARKQENKGVGFFGRLIMFKIPAYVPAAIILLMIFITPYFFESKTLTKIVAVKEKAKPETIVVTDTVTIEKNIPTYIKVPVIKYIEVDKSNDNSSDLELVNALAEKNADQLMIPANIESAKLQLESQLKNIGKSANEQEELSKFIVVSR